MEKVLRVITRLNIGGPAIHTILLSELLNKNGYKDILVCGKTSDAEGDMSYLAEEKDVKLRFVNDLGRDISFLKDIKAFFAIFSIIRKEKPDIVHTHTAKAGTLGRLAAIFAGVPVRIHTFHGHIFDGYFSLLKTRIFLHIEKFLAHFTDRLVVVSEAVKAELVNNLKVMKADKAVVIPLGFELDKFIDCESKKGDFRRMIKADHDTLLVGIVGRLVPIKNHKMFLDVVIKIKEKARHIKAKFLIIGDGELRGVLEEYVKDKNLSKIVEFTGWIKDLSAVYADLDVVCLTSLNEGTPVSLIEAMASGRAVVATDVGGVKDLITNGVSGILSRSGDVDGFSDKLIGLMKDPEKRKQLGMYGKSAVMEKYSKERLLADIKKLYQQCLLEKGIADRGISK